MTRKDSDDRPFHYAAKIGAFCMLLGIMMNYRNNSKIIGADFCVQNGLLFRCADGKIKKQPYSITEKRGIK